jgi:hypothetical protein
MGGYGSGGYGEVSGSDSGGGSGDNGMSGVNQNIVGGFSMSQIIDMANRRTELRGKSLDLNGELLTALQEVCMEHRWWWRRRIVPFTLNAGQSKYSLLNPSQIAAVDFQQMAKNGFKIFPPGQTQGASPNPVPGWGCRFHCPEPIFDADAQETIIALQSQFPAGMPCGYFITGGGLLITDKIPDQNYPASIAYWAVPFYTDDDLPESVPLIPVSLHGLLIKRLEMHIERYIVGEDSNKYSTVAEEYGELKEKALVYQDFAEGRFQEVRTRDFNDAVQST